MIGSCRCAIEIFQTFPKYFTWDYDLKHACSLSAFENLNPKSQLLLFSGIYLFKVTDIVIGKFEEIFDIVLVFL